MIVYSLNQLRICKPTREQERTAKRDNVRKWNEMERTIFDYLNLRELKMSGFTNNFTNNCSLHGSVLEKSLHKIPVCSVQSEARVVCRCHGNRQQPTTLQLDNGNHNRARDNQEPAGTSGSATD